VIGRLVSSLVGILPVDSAYQSAKAMVERGTKTNIESSGFQAKYNSNATAIPHSHPITP